MSNIFIIMGREWNKNRVVADLKDEGYPHRFFIGDIKKPNQFQRHMKIADEVWCFGDCSDNIMKLYAERNGYDLWQMG